MKPDEINKIKKLLIPVLVKNDVNKVIMFGSSARDSETKKSDIDLMIIMDTQKRFFDRYEQFEVINEIFRDRTVDLLIYSQDELNSISHRPFIKRILHEGLTIYEC